MSNKFKERDFCNQIKNRDLRQVLTIQKNVNEFSVFVSSHNFINGVNGSRIKPKHFNVFLLAKIIIHMKNTKYSTYFQLYYLV